MTKTPEIIINGRGKILEKRRIEHAQGCLVFYRVMKEFRPDWFDEVQILAYGQDDEPDVCEEIEWSEARLIRWGAGFKKSLTKIGLPERIDV